MIEPTDQPTLLTGITGNKYIICTNLARLEFVCTLIEKSVKSIQWVDRYQAYAVRLKSRKHKHAAKQILPK